MIINELLLNFLGHTGKGVVSSLQFTGESLEGAGNLLFHFLVLSLSETRVEGVAFQRASTTDTSGNDILSFRINIHESIAITEGRGGVLVGLLESTVVVFNDGVEKISEDGVRLGVRSIDTNSRVQVLNTFTRTGKINTVE